ncbi:MAG: [FeFe] hydrogenase H-cluster radical SAM maturase HydG [bacterium]
MTNIIDEQKIFNTLDKHQQPDRILVQEILSKASELGGLSAEDVATLIAIDSEELLLEVFHTAKKVKEAIYGNRLVIFAPLYASNTCTNNCLYCAFRTDNKELKRRTLSQTEIAEETKLLIDQGQKRIVLLTGEAHDHDNFQYILDSIATIYATKSGAGKICRVNTNIAPYTVENFRRLKAANIGTYQLFQETYHRDTYQKMHAAGKKADYDWHITAMDRAMTAGIDDVGIGALFGLANWHFEILALLQHIAHLNQEFGIGPHTISVPRLEPASGSNIASSPPYLVSDQDFCKIIAILRLAVPYTGIILSTRESVALRRQCFELGVSQISAGSRTSPGGYSESKDKFNASQFSVGDCRNLDEVVKDIVSLGFMPSFCTACYRLGRTGESFMELAKTGKIKNMCTPNAIVTFKEYLLHYASPDTRDAGEKLIAKELAASSEQQKQLTLKLIAQLEEGTQEAYI